MGKICCILWNSTQNISPIHRKIWFVYNIEILRDLIFKSLYAFLKCPPGPVINMDQSELQILQYWEPTKINLIEVQLQYCVTVMSQWVWWHLKSPASRLFTQPFIQQADQRKHESSVSLAFVRGIHQWLVNSPHKGPVTQNMFPFDDVIRSGYSCWWWICMLFWISSNFNCYLNPRCFASPTDTLLLFSRSLDGRYWPHCYHFCWYFKSG